MRQFPRFQESRISFSLSTYFYIKKKRRNNSIFGKPWVEASFFFLLQDAELFFPLYTSNIFTVHDLNFQKHYFMATIRILGSLPKMVIFCTAVYSFDDLIFHSSSSSIIWSLSTYWRGYGDLLADLLASHYISSQELHF